MLGIRMCILEFFIISVQNTFASVNIECVRLKMPEIMHFGSWCKVSHLKQN